MSLLHVGVGSFSNHMSRPNRWLRRYALFFERFEIIDLDQCLHLHRTNVHGKAETVRECDWLIENRYLSQFGYEDLIAPSSDPDLIALDLQIDELERERNHLDEEYKSHFDPHGGRQVVPNFLVPTLEKIISIGSEISALRAVRAALVVRAKGRAIATNLEMSGFPGQAGVDADLSSPDLLRFLIEGLPVPAQRVPWTEILAFKTDDDSQERLRSLRAWVATTARGGVSLAEASDRIEDALTAYRQHVRGAGIAHDLASWEALLRSGIVSAHESIDAWMEGSTARPFNLAVIAAGELAERYAPGRELSYLVKIEDSGL